MSYEYKEQKRVRDVLRGGPGDAGKRPSKAFLKGKETGFPTKSEFARFFKPASQFRTSGGEWSKHRFASAADAPREMRPWVADQLKSEAASRGYSVNKLTAFWCRLPKGPVGQDGVPPEGTLLKLYKQGHKGDIPDKLGEFVVLRASARTSTRERGVCFVIVCPNRMDE